MNPLLVVAIPLGLVIIGMILNGMGLAYDQPPSSPEQDPVKRLTAEKESYRKFFDLQRSRSLKRQKRVTQYGWLLMISFVGAFVWLYLDTVKKTTISTQVAALQTMPTEEGKQMVLSMTLSDGSIRNGYTVKIRNTTHEAIPLRVAVANEPTPTADVLVSVLATLKPGQRVPVELLRPNGRRVTVTVTLGELRGG